jgi:hypothetical protein
MKHADHVTKLDWAKLPANFRRIRLELAREKGHPQGSALIGYTFVAPLELTPICGTSTMTSAASSVSAPTNRTTSAT